MITTFLMQHDNKQLVFTPESESEKAIFRMFPEGAELSVKRGSFFNKCQGGWVREFSDDDSLILVMEKLPILTP